MVQEGWIAEDLPDYEVSWTRADAGSAVRDAMVNGEERSLTEENLYGTALHGLISFGGFMQGAGPIQEVPDSWRGPVYPDPEGADGSRDETMVRVAGPGLRDPSSPYEPRFMPSTSTSTTSGRANSGGGYSPRSSISWRRASEIKTWEEGAWGQVLEETMP